MEYGFHSFLVIKLTAPCSSALKHDILTGSNPGTFTCVRKHGHAISGTLAHRLHSLDPVLPSVFHNESEGSFRNEDALYKFLGCKGSDGLCIEGGRRKHVVQCLMQDHRTKLAITWIRH